MLANISAFWFQVIKSRAGLLILLCILIAIPAAILASNVEMTSAYDTYVSKDSQGYKDLKAFDQYFAGDQLMLIMQADSYDTLLSDSNYEALKKVEAELSTLPNAFSVSSPAFLAEFMRPQMPTGTPTQTIIIDPTTGKPRSSFASFFFQGPQVPMPTMRLILTFKGNLPLPDKGAIADEMRAVADKAGFQGITSTVSGSSVVMWYIEENLGSALGVVMIIAFVLMFLVLAFFFRMRGFFVWRWLALAVVAVGVIYTIGIMGLIDLNIALASMGVFPILLGLGVDYVVQFHNRYDEELRKGKTADEAGLAAFTHIGPPIIIAVIVGCVAFTTSLFSLTPMVQDFGKMLIIGVLVLLIVAPTLLMSGLYRRDRSKPAQADAKIEVAVIEKGLAWLAPLVVKLAIPIIVIAVVLTGIGWAYDEKIESTAAAQDFVAADVQAAKDLQLLINLAGGASASYMLIDAPDITDPAMLQWMIERKQAALSKYSRVEGKGIIANATSIADLISQFNGGELPETADQAKAIVNKIPVPMKANMITPDLKHANITVSLATSTVDTYRQGMEQVLAIWGDNPPPNNTQFIPWTGVVFLSPKLAKDLDDSRGKMVYIGIILCLAALLVLFKLNWKRVITAALPIGLILGWSSGVTYWESRSTPSWLP
ncbi:MAG: MMPL family transporter [Dehalococcoidia bacterium]|nr:MMPL family transporter [Dehalococcoidia bacterium]